MKDLLNNLPPFYVGQKVVCIRDGEANSFFRTVIIKKNTNHEITECKYIKDDPLCYDGWVVKVKQFPDTWWTYSRFRVIEQKRFPSIRFSEVKIHEDLKKENNQIIIEN